MLDGIKINVARSLLSTFRKDNLVDIGSGRYRLREQGNDYGSRCLLLKESEKGLSIEGSLGYAINGNSFEYNGAEVIRGYVDYISNRIGVDLLCGNVKYFEAGVVVAVPFKYDEFS